MGNKLLNYFSREEYLSVFLGLLVVFVFIIAPIGHQYPLFEPCITAFFGLLLIAGLIASTESPKLTAFATGAVLVALGLSLTRIFVALDGAWVILSELARLIALGLFLYALILQTMKHGTISSHRLKGGIAVYLLIGMFCAKLFHLCALLQPVAFQGLDGDSPFPSFLYFSFVTLTTLGYGDILPLSDYARSIATAEGFVGQLFPAIFIARLVTLQADQRSHRDLL